MNLNPLTIADGCRLEFIAERGKKMIEKQVRAYAHNSLKLANTLTKALEVVTNEITLRMYRNQKEVYEREAKAYNNVLKLFNKKPERTDDFDAEFLDWLLIVK